MDIMYTLRTLDNPKAVVLSAFICSFSVIDNQMNITIYLLCLLFEAPQVLQ